MRDQADADPRGGLNNPVLTVYRWHEPGVGLGSFELIRARACLPRRRVFLGALDVLMLASCFAPALMRYSMRAAMAAPAGASDSGGQVPRKANPWLCTLAATACGGLSPTAQSTPPRRAIAGFWSGRSGAHHSWPKGVRE